MIDKYQFALTVEADHANKTTAMKLWEHGKLIAQIPYKHYDLLVSIIEQFKGKGACDDYQNRPLHDVYGTEFMHMAGIPGQPALCVDE